VTFEIIVVDNGSTDGSAEMAENEFHARVIRNSENRGFCAANNQGIDVAKGEWIALLNNDAEAEPGWLASLQAACSPRSDVGMAASKVLIWEDPSRIDKVGHLIFPDGQNRGRGAGNIDRGQFDREEEVLWPDGCAAMYRKQMLDEIGGFDAGLARFGAQTVVLDFVERALAAGFLVGYRDTPGLAPAGAYRPARRVLEWQRWAATGTLLVLSARRGGGAEGWLRLTARFVDAMWQSLVAGRSGRRWWVGTRLALLAGCIRALLD